MLPWSAYAHVGGDQTTATLAADPRFARERESFKDVTFPDGVH